MFTSFRLENMFYVITFNLYIKRASLIAHMIINHPFSFTFSVYYVLIFFDIL